MKARVKSTEMHKPYKLSRDYRLLKKLLDNGNEIVCFFDGEVCRGRVLEDKRYYFSVRGWCYNDFSKVCSQASFSEYMSQDNVEFIYPITHNNTGIENENEKTEKTNPCGFSQTDV